jgi:hypothetical protein
VRDSPSCSRRDEGFARFEIVLKRGRNRWRWHVRTPAGEVVNGSDRSRAGARYRAERALFVLLSASASRLSKWLAESSGFLSRAATAVRDPDPTKAADVRVKKDELTRALRRARGNDETPLNKG